MLEHFLNDKIYSTYSSLFCFTETNINDSPAKHIDEILDDWKDIHKNTHHGLAFCYNVNKVNIIEVIEIPGVLEVLPIVLKIEKETVLLVIVYRMPGPLGSFIGDFISLINELPTQHRMSIVGDFNLDQMLLEHVAKVNPLIQNFNLSQRSQYSTHIHGGILDLVFDTSNSNAVFFVFFAITLQWSLCSFFPNLMHYFIQNLAVSNLAFNPHYLTHKYLCWWYLDTRVSENLLWKQSPRNVNYHF